MDKRSDLERFKNLSYEDFKALASDDSLSMYQKIGFPAEYRKGKEADIFKDIVQKLGLDSDSKGKILLDIGPGCSELPLMILDLCDILVSRPMKCRSGEDENRAIDKKGEHERGGGIDCAKLDRLTHAV